MSVLSKLVHRIEMLLVKALVSVVDDTNDIQLVKFTSLADDTEDGIERLQNYGMSSVPPKGGEMMVGYLNGNRDHGVVLVIDSGVYRPRGLNDGEAVFYSLHGQTVLLDENGDCVFNSGTQTSVQYEALQAAYEELQGRWNVFANSYTPGQGGAGIATASTGDITAAQVPTIKVPAKEVIE
jgi:phage baseplate assembly protein V